VDYEGGGHELDPAALAAALLELPGAAHIEWCFEPGRWLVAHAGTLVAEVLWDKRRDDDGEEHRFVVIAAGMNDLLRPALYGAHHRIGPLAPRSGLVAPADVVGPVCESSDTFATGVALPPLERGDLMAILDVGAYGAVMSSHYNGRGALPQVVHEGGKLALAGPAAPAPGASSSTPLTPL
jgi:diaminopimelate decarboxylase